MTLCISQLSYSMTLRSIVTLVLISFFTIGGCNDNNGSNNGNGGGVGAPPPAPQTSCTLATVPCTSTFQFNGAFVCASLDSSACAVDLEQIINQIDPNKLGLVSNDTTIIIEAWGAHGGNAANGGTSGAEGGIAVTTTTINDIKAQNNSSSILYYFLGSPGLNADERCGGGGGVATIITTEDLALNPTSNPTQSAPPVLLVAGGGGGGAAGNQVGLCLTKSEIIAGDGGAAFASMTADGQGPGLDAVSRRGDAGFNVGGNWDGNGSGGGGSTPSGSGTPAQPGANGFGGLGGVGGSGPGCEGFGANNFINTPVQLSITTGLGGNGGSARGSCAAGGGAGGGGYGGGGGGTHGNETETVVAGAGGGSFAIQSTQSSTLAPTTRQPNPCGASGCVRITFDP